MTLADRYRRWFEYEKDAHNKVIASLAAAPANLRAEPRHQSAVDLLAHIAAARMMWLYRMGISRMRVDDLSPAGLSLDEARRRLEEMHTAWTAYLASLDDGELSRLFEYASFEGPRFRNTVEDILTQLFGHSWSHRAQISSLVRSIGAEPAATDFIFWAREPVPGAETAAG